MFNPRTVKRLCQDIAISEKQKNAAKEWLKLLKENKLEDETKNYFRFASIILENILEYNIKEFDFESGNVEFQFGDSNKKNILCFEVKGTKIKDLFAFQHRAKKEHSTPIKQTWDYMGNTGLEYGICTNYKEFVLITKQYGYSKYFLFDFESILNDESKLKEFISIFSKTHLIDEGFANKISEESITEEKEFTNEFYKLFHETRLILIKSFQEKENVSKNESIFYTQIFLNRLMFIFFVEDKSFVPDKKIFYDRVLKLLHAVEPSEHSRKIFDDINELFTIFDKGSDKLNIFGFNGGLFSGTIPNKIYFNDLNDKYLFRDIWQHSKLLQSTKLDNNASRIIKKYPTLNPIISNLLIMDSFDFNTEVSVNILGHIFEQSISDLEELEKKGISKRKKDGVYYTPEYITDYICRNTIIPYLSKSGKITDIHDLISEYADSIETLEQKFRNIKICDPACGSGAFLIKAVDVLLDVYKSIQGYKELLGKYSGLDKWNEESEAMAIIENNIYGVDINEQSVEITRLSLFFKIASSTRKLPDLSKNIKVGNSLISDKTIDPKAFVWEEEFPEILNPLIDEKGFDIIIGNPPYVKHQDLQNKDKMNLPDNTKLCLVDCQIDKTSDLSGYFFYHSINLLKPCGILGFISSETWMNSKYGKPLQKLILSNTKISQITCAIFNIFEEADTKAAIVILQRSISKNNIMFNLARNVGDFQQFKFSEQKKICQNTLTVGNWIVLFKPTLPDLDIPFIFLQNVGKVTYGEITGYKKFFILSKKTIQKYQIPKRYLVPTISKDTPKGLLDHDCANEYLLNVNEPFFELEEYDDCKGLIKYIEYGENIDIIPKRGANRKKIKLPQCTKPKTRKIWYSLNLKNPPAIILRRILNKNLDVWENNGMFYTTNTLAHFTPVLKELTHAYLAFLVTSYYQFYLETIGTTMGGGALSLEVYNYKESRVPDFKHMKSEIVKKLGDIWIKYRDDIDGNKNKFDKEVLSVLGLNEEQISYISIKLNDMVKSRTLKT